MHWQRELIWAELLAVCIDKYSRNWVFERGVGEFYGDIVSVILSIEVSPRGFAGVVGVDRMCSFVEFSDGCAFQYDSSVWGDGVL